MLNTDKSIIRDITKRYLDICNDPIQDARRDLWRKHNSLKETQPLIYVHAFAWKEMPEAECLCENPLLRQIEEFLRFMLFRNTFNDDFIYEPWVTMSASYKCNGWGLPIERTFSDEPGGSFKVDYPIKTLSDVNKLRTPSHKIDEEKTSENIELLTDVIGDIIAINIDRGPAYRAWTGDISTDLGYLRGIENLMMDMIDNSEWLHNLIKFIRDGILKTHIEAENAGDWGLCAHQNQSMPYSEELPDPALNVNGVKRNMLWGYMAAQEFTGVSPYMHDEFLLQYQLPILKEFGLIAYGCCEDLTNKIEMLRQIPNLRRIAVSPFADVTKCAEQIGQDYLLSYRPNPPEMVCCGFDPDRIKAILTKALKSCRNCHMDITLKDVQTVENDPDRIRKWVEITRKVIDDVF